MRKLNVAQRLWALENYYSNKSKLTKTCNEFVVKFGHEFCVEYDPSNEGEANVQEEDTEDDAEDGDDEETPRKTTQKSFYQNFVATKEMPINPMRFVKTMRRMIKKFETSGR